MRRTLPLLFCVMLAAEVAACRTTPTGSVPEYQFTDLTGAYVAFFYRTQDLTTDARVAAFKTDVGAQLPGFYDATRMAEISGMTLAQYDDEIARSFTTFQSGVNPSRARQPRSRRCCGPRSIRSSALSMIFGT